MFRRVSPSAFGDGVTRRIAFNMHWCYDSPVIARSERLPLADMSDAAISPALTAHLLNSAESVSPFPFPRELEMPALCQPREYFILFQVVIVEA